MRPGKVFGACGEHVNLDERYIFIPTGEDPIRPEDHPANQSGVRDARQALDAREAVRRGCTNQVIMRRHKELCKRLGFDFRLYDFRHTYGSRMAMAGVDLMTLRELMGHSSITITQRTQARNTTPSDLIRQFREITQDSENLDKRKGESRSSLALLQLSVDPYHVLAGRIQIQ